MRTRKVRRRERKRYVNRTWIKTENGEKQEENKKKDKEEEEEEKTGKAGMKVREITS